MKLSPAAEFGIRGVAVLAEDYGKGPLSLAEICRRRKIAREYLVKIFAALVRARLVRAVRGKHGGYVLARPPSKITLLQVIEAVEGPITLNYCTYSPPRCDETGCPIRDVWRDLQKTVRKRLASVTMDACIPVSQRDARSRRRGAIRGGAGTAGS